MQKLFDRFEKFEMLQKRDKICDKITEGNFQTTSGHFRVDRNIPLGSELTPLSGSRVNNDMKLIFLSFETMDGSIYITTFDYHVGKFKYPKHLYEISRQKNNPYLPLFNCNE